METEFEQRPLANKFRIMFWVALLAVVLIFGFGEFGNRKDLVIRNSDGYQVVFLDNQQVYFGKLQAVNDDFWSLTDVYYLRAGTMQTNSDMNIKDPESALIGGQVDLIKLGAELHGPTDEMLINKAHVIYYEDMGEDSQIRKLIDEHKNNK